MSDNLAKVRVAEIAGEKNSNDREGCVTISLKDLTPFLNRIPVEHRDDAKLYFKVTDYGDCIITHIYLFYERPKTPEEIDDNRRLEEGLREAERNRILEWLRQNPDLVSDIREGRVSL